MSANVDVLRRSGQLPPEPEIELPEFEVAGETPHWNQHDFAREQIRSLVRRVFFGGIARPAKQVVFSAAGGNTNVGGICDRVGEALALETCSDVAIVTREPKQRTESPRFARMTTTAIKSRSTQTAINLWRVPGLAIRDRCEESRNGGYWLSCLAELRNEFEFAVIHGPAAGISCDAALLGEFADGIILVLEANRTRRATVRKIKETLEATPSKILGTILSERTFPIPERIYRRL